MRRRWTTATTNILNSGHLRLRRTINRNLITSSIKLPTSNRHRCINSDCSRCRLQQASMASTSNRPQPPASTQTGRLPSIMVQISPPRSVGYLRHRPVNKPATFHPAALGPCATVSSCNLIPTRFDRNPNRNIIQMRDSCTLNPRRFIAVTLEAVSTGFIISRHQEIRT